MTAIDNSQRTGIALDIGEKRIGVATANLGVRFAGPYTTLEKPGTFVDDILEICRQEAAAWVVIGLPRGLDGQDTAQTSRVRAFGQELEQRLAHDALAVPVYWIDEALTSQKAEAELSSRGGKHNLFQKADVDALAATYILEDFLREQGDKPGRTAP